MFEKIFPADVMSKRERVETTLALQPVDRAAILEQLSYNSRVIAAYTGKPIEGFDYAIEDVGEVIRQTTDLIMPPRAPLGTDRYTTDDGFIIQNDNWQCWHAGRPFTDARGARDWLLGETKKLRETPFDARLAREEYRRYMTETQALIGETVLLNYSWTGFCNVFDKMGLELYTYFFLEYPEVLDEFMELTVAVEVRRIHAVADAALSPVVLIPEDFSSKRGPIFSPDFCRRYHHVGVRKCAAAWHEHGVKALFHSDGNYKAALPDLLACGVDGFYCLEPNAGMDIVELKNTYPHVTWSGGIDGVDLMERGTPAQVRESVHHQIRATNALETGGMFVATSSEINPPVKPENFRAMIEAVGEIRNPAFRR
ncbi:MAG: hypothetical protein IT426_19555 [Pirellulales bacterium]|nr:hypothetical protein [Pirellulales bacterium]